MAYEPKDNTGSLFRNEDKKAENHPDYKGSALVNGTPMWVAGWLKTTKDGGKFLSLAFQEKTAKPQPAPKKQTIHDMKDDIPF